MQINLLGGSYNQRFIAANCQRTINWYPVTTNQTEQNKTQLALYPSPGQSLYCDVGNTYTYIRGLFTARTHEATRCFFVADNTLFELTAPNTKVNRGTLTNLTITATPVYIVCNLLNELAIFGDTASYVLDMTTNILTEITDIEFPGDITHACYLDQYAIVVSDGAVFESLTSSFLDWSALQSYSTTFTAAPVLAVGALKEQIYNFTSESIEVYLNDGTSPYSRLPRSTQLTGILAKDSLATFSGGFLFLGTNKDGQAAVYFYNGWDTPVQISNTSITWQLNQGVVSSMVNAYGYLQYTKDGHLLYYLTIPSLHTTYIYDQTNNYWHERQSRNNYTDNALTYFRGQYTTNWNGVNLFVDSFYPQILFEDFTVNTEYDTTASNQVLSRIRISQIYSEELKNISVDQLILDGNMGCGTIVTPSPTLTVYWSIDGGQTFPKSAVMPLGTQNNFTWRGRVNKLGTGRNWALKFVLTDNVTFMMQNAIVHGTVDEF